jgi:alanine racemase
VRSTTHDISTLARLTSGTHAVINLDAYEANIRVLRSLVPQSTAFMAVVKADAYGHGAAQCALAAQQAGAAWIGVARISEARYLRANGTTAPILVLGPPNMAEIGDAIDQDITLALGTLQSISAVSDVGIRLGRPARVHLKIDTGMHRFGVAPELGAQAARLIEDAPGLALDGVFTHFSCADECDPTATVTETSRFEEAISAIHRAGIEPRWVHLANSAAIVTGRIGPANMVRSGILTHGLSPSDEVTADERFTPTMSIRSVVGRIASLRSGEGVSYGMLYKAKADEPLATIPIGYADGLPRTLANQGWFVINGERRPIRGRVCMDQTIVGNAAGVNEGDVAIIIGPGSEGAMTFESAGHLVGTNCYEVATRLMPRVPRLYRRGERFVAWEHLLTGERGTLG